MLHGCQRARTGGAVMMMMVMICAPPPPFRRVRLASMLLFRLVTFYVYAEGLSRSKLSEEYTHKYCLFLACLQAARVWSLLKSPESDSKISSIRIPALDLHMSLIVVMTHMSLLCVDVFSCICLLTSSGSALRLIVFNMLSSFRHANGDISSQMLSLLSADEMCLT